MRKKDWLMVGLLMSLVLGIYLIRIDQITPGAWGDEITMGEVSLRLTEEKKWVIFESTNYGHPTPYLYLLGISLKALGKSLLSLRLVSVIFGALSSGLMYVLVKTITKNRHLAVAGAVLLASSYPMIVLSRFAYEITMGIFGELAVILALWQYGKKPSWQRSVWVGVSLGFGLWSYLGFRSLAVGLAAILTVIALRGKASLKRGLIHLVVAVMVLGITAGPLLYWGWKNPDEFWARARAVSVFEQGLPKDEVVKEVSAATKRTLSMFLFTGDPNPRQNPGQTSVFDLGTTLLMLMGIVGGLKKHKGAVVAGLGLMVISLLNDILTLERIPEFHYYGLGHPNILRLGSIIPLVILLVVLGMRTLGELINDKDNRIYSYYLVILLLAIVNGHRYFGQQILGFNYVVNGADKLQAVEVLNQTEGRVAASQSIFDDQRVKFFSRKPVDKITLEEVMVGGKGSGYQLVLIDPRDDDELAKKLLNNPEQFTDYEVAAKANPFGGIDYLILKLDK